MQKGTNMEKILIIGTEVPISDDLRQSIEREGYEILTASDRKQGVQHLREHHPVVVLVEHPLGDDNGVDVLKELMEIDPKCEVILVTAGGEVEIAIEVLRAGALDYLQKPVDIKQLLIALGRARERRHQRRASSEPANILVLEDHEPTLKRLVSVLRKEGYNVLSAGDGEEGIRIYQNTRLDLILADVRMPLKDGLEVLRETKGSGADLEVIVITGYGDEEIVVEALREGAINFLKKPVDIEQMLLAIQKALEYQTLRRSLAYRNRDVELMQELVVRLTNKLELIVETPKVMSREVQDFLHQLIDSLPLGILVADSERRVMFANRHIVTTIGLSPEELCSEWLGDMGVKNVTDEQLDEAFANVMGSAPGTIETLLISKWAFLIMTPLKLIRPDSSEKYVALAIRGERKYKSDPSPTKS